jgi:hypothetical protein
MRRLEVRLDELDAWIADGMYKYGRVALRISLAAVFIWFGALKPLGLSPAEEVVRHTVYWMDPGVFVPLLGYWEIAIGVGLLVRPFIRVSLFLLAVQMPGTLMPLFLLPDICFTQIPFWPDSGGTVYHQECDAYQRRHCRWRNRASPVRRAQNSVGRSIGTSECLRPVYGRIRLQIRFRTILVGGVGPGCTVYAFLCFLKLCQDLLRRPQPFRIFQKGLDDKGMGFHRLCIDELEPWGPVPLTVLHVHRFVLDDGDFV